MYKQILYGLYKRLLGDRYGFDQLGKFCFILLGILIILDFFVDSYTVGLLQVFTMVLIVYRFSSKKIYKRCRENEKYLDIKNFIFKPFRNIKRCFKDKKHIYKKCRCGTTLKLNLPKKRGIKHTTCPSCKRRIAFIAFRCRKKN